jgi:hypothetical protein
MIVSHVNLALKGAQKRRPKNLMGKGKTLQPRIRARTLTFGTLAKVNAINEFKRSTKLMLISFFPLQLLFHINTMPSQSMMKCCKRKFYLACSER